TVTTSTPSGVVRWYTVATGGTFTLTEPVPNLNVAGQYHYWVSQIDSGCEGPRTPVTIVVHKKPAPPTFPTPQYCQFFPSNTFVATLDTVGSPETPTYYGPGVTIGTTSAPVPNTSTAPDTIIYYATGTSSFGCVSDSGMGKVIIKAKPDV